MSLQRIANLLDVDEVKINHGPRGVAAYVRVDRAWHGATIDNEQLGATRRDRLGAITKSLCALADQHSPARKSMAAATLSAAAEGLADRAWRMRRLASGQGIPVAGGSQVQVQAAEPEPAPIEAPAAPMPATLTAPMPSRFHAIMAELGSL